MDAAVPGGKRQISGLRHKHFVAYGPAAVIVRIGATGANLSASGVGMHLAGQESGFGVTIRPRLDFGADQNVVSGPALDLDPTVPAGIDVQFSCAADGLLRDVD